MKGKFHSEYNKLLKHGKLHKHPMGGGGMVSSGYHHRGVGHNSY